MRSVVNIEHSVTKPIETFELSNPLYGKVTLIDAYDSFTHNLVQDFLKLGAPVTVMRSKEVIIEHIEQHLGTYLVLSPGPGTPSSAGILKEAFEIFQNRLPILGVCLGMQAINEVYGGITESALKIVHGKTSDITHDGTGIFHDIPSPTRVGRYHSLRVSNIPSNLQIQSEFEGIPMAFHIPDKVAAVQFHPESFLTEYGMTMLRNFLEGRI